MKLNKNYETTENLRKIFKRITFHRDKVRLLCDYKKVTCTHFCEITKVYFCQAKSRYFQTEKALCAQVTETTVELIADTETEYDKEMSAIKNISIILPIMLL